MGELQRVHEVSTCAQMFDDERVGIPDNFSTQPLRRGCVEGAIPLNGAVNLETLSKSRSVIIVAMPWCGVDETSAIFHRDIVGRDDATRSIAEWMAVLESDKCAAERRCESFHSGGTDDRGNFPEHLGGDDCERAIHLDECVRMRWVHCNGEICGKGPWRRRPNHERGCALALDAKRPVNLRSVSRFEVNINGWIHPIFILELCFGERCLIRDRPVNRLQLTKDIALIEQSSEDLERASLILGLHREVGVRVIRKRQEPLHLRRLRLDELCGIGSAFAANRHTAMIVAERVEFRSLATLDKPSHHSMFDRKSVAIPSWHVMTRATFHEHTTNHDVLEHLVEQMPDVDRSICIWRPIVKNEGLSRSACGCDCPDDIACLPSCERRRLGLREIRLHRKRSLRQV